MTKTLTGIRPSLWARCPTAAVFQGRGEEAAEPLPETAEYFFRGNVFEEIVVRQVIAKNGADDVEREVVIPIPGIGEGHADFYLRSTKTLGEIKSTAQAFPESDTFTYGVRQLRIYLTFHPEAEQGALMMIDPNRMKPADVYTVHLSDEDRELIESERRYITQCISDGPLPDHGTSLRPCKKPSQARGRMCPFATACFGEDWEPPATRTVEDPEAIDVAAEVISIAAQERPHKEALADLNAKRKELQAELGEYVDYGEYQVGGFTVKRWRVNGKRSVSAKALEAAGFDTAPFATLGEGHDRYEVRLNDAEFIPPTDFGDEAPF